MSKISLFSVWFGMGQYDLNTSYVGESKKKTRFAVNLLYFKKKAMQKLL